ncbi:MAG: phosphatidate cytidylyltransferase [Deltaproteobacteria bacterium]|nr:phosphatidate cytidylyltransferase [Deltaproteobacteria bacterium]
MHLKRWLTAIIGLPILLFLIAHGPRWIFYTLLYLASVCGLSEFYRISASNLPKFFLWPIYVISFLLFLFTYRGEFYFAQVFILLWSFVPMTLAMLIVRSPRPESTGDMGKALLGPVYVCLPLVMLIIIDRYPNGNLWILFLLTIIFANDTGAFYFGKFFGKHKLYETVSPAKTWEGAIGGVLSSFIVAPPFLFVLSLFHVPPLYRFNVSTLILILALSTIGQVGDLVESMLKRNHGVKDSSRILPGHGGVLDRIDSLLFAIPVLYIYLWLRIG